jgi:hypothetical protein
MNRFFAGIWLTMVFSICAFSQTKPLSDVETEIKTFANSGNFSAVYDSAKYVTRVEVGFDILEPKDALQKQFKKFQFKLTSLFAVQGIEERSVRNTLCVNTQSKRFYFSNDRNLTVRLDGETINLGEADRSTEVKGRKVKENMCWEIDAEIIRDFGKASTFEYRIGATIGNINAAKLQFFKDYAKLLKVDKN